MTPGEIEQERQRFRANVVPGQLTDEATFRSFLNYLSQNWPDMTTGGYDRMIGGQYSSFFPNVKQGGGPFNPDTALRTGNEPFTNPPLIGPPGPPRLRYD